MVKLVVLWDSIWPKLEANIAAVGPPARLRGVTRAPSDTPPAPHERTGTDDRYAGGAGAPASSGGTTGTCRMRRWTKDRETSKRRREEGAAGFIASFRTHCTGQGNRWQPDRWGLDTREDVLSDRRLARHRRRTIQPYLLQMASRETISVVKGALVEVTVYSRRKIAASFTDR
jgi:hypothetical protein